MIALRKLHNIMNYHSQSSDLYCNKYQIFEQKLLGTSLGHSEVNLKLLESIRIQS